MRHSYENSLTVPASWALAQRIGYLYSEGEIIYLADTPFERLLDIQRQVGQCQTMTSLSQADFEARLEAVFHQNTGESQQIAQDIDQSVDLLSLSEEMPANEDLLNEDSAAPVIRLINAILSEAIKETASDIHIETYEKTMSIRFRIDGVLRTILQPNKNWRHCLSPELRSWLVLISPKNVFHRMEGSVCVSGDVT